MEFITRAIVTIGIAAAICARPATAQNLNIFTVHPVTFPSQYRMTVAGNLYIRNHLSLSINTSVIVSTNLYATKLAEQGFVTLSINVSFWGGSEGEPRNAVAPDLYAESSSVVVDFLGTEDFVDRERIGGFRICGSESFIIINRNGLRRAQSFEQRKESINTASQQRWNETDGGAIRYTGGTPQAITNSSTAVDREFFDFYRTPRGEFTPEGSLPTLTTYPTLSSNVKFMNVYPFNDIDSISPRPLLFIAGDLAHSRAFSEDAYALAAEPKELYWVPSAGYVDLYDRVQLIPFEKLTQFFRTSLV
ncbi:hypothetical protein EK21DRAFT_96807 [Setomelanomma holmii]|uniref:Uncharacterized protein n=1 Tax=Setomelanomma holmii TaxID=210430 RepID=A0A9P4LUC5_9PLEO|nr:hypothetical protein EK21DRAFT_96807 [Setomelanomma holmii]